MKNIRLLQKVKRHILEEPKRLYMHDFVQRIGDGHTSVGAESFPPCGTVGCIAGWVCLLKFGMKYRASSGTADEAAKLLGLDDGQWNELFMRDCDRQTTKEDAEFIASKIDHFIAKHRPKRKP